MTQQHVKLAANPDYFRGKPKIDTIAIQCPLAVILVAAHPISQNRRGLHLKVEDTRSAQSEGSTATVAKQSARAFTLLKSISTLDQGGRP